MTVTWPQFNDPLFRKQARIIRRRSGVRTEHGEWEYGDETAEDVIIIIQPMDEKLMPTEPGYRVEDMRRVWMRADANIEIKGTSTTPDMLEYGGERFLVYSKKDWGNHLELMVVRST